MYNFNNYEPLREPLEIDPECEYIYITDNPNLKSNIWKIIIDKDLDGLDIFNKCYKVRFNVFKYCNTDICIYLDGSIQINKSLSKLYNDFIKSNCDLGLQVHPERNNIIAEYNIWVKYRNYPLENYKKAINTMHSLGYDFNYKGLIQMTTRIIKRSTKNIEIDAMTYNMLKLLGDNKIERLDQTVYTFILNKYFNDIKVMPMSQQIMQSDYLTWCHHNTNTPIIYNPFNDNNGYLFNKIVKLYRL